MRTRLSIVYPIACAIIAVVFDDFLVYEFRRAFPKKTHTLARARALAHYEFSTAIIARFGGREAVWRFVDATRIHV